MDYRLPYYMAYPMPLQYDDERIERYDFEYMKSMYPQTAKKVLPYVEDECDRMEYEGSMMYDEYPDQLQLRLMCRRVYDRMMREEKEELEMADEEDVEQQYLPDEIKDAVFYEASDNGYEQTIKAHMKRIKDEA